MPRIPSLAPGQPHVCPRGLSNGQGAPKPNLVPRAFAAARAALVRSLIRLASSSASVPFRVFELERENGAALFLRRVAKTRQYVALMALGFPTLTREHGRR